MQAMDPAPASIHPVLIWAPLAIQAGGWLVAVAGVAVTVTKLRADFKQARDQRERDIEARKREALRLESDARWRQAQAAKELNDEMLDDPFAWQALQMLDYPSEEAEVGPLKFVASADSIRGALSVGSLDKNDAPGRAIRRCFDSFFYYLAVFQHHIDNQLVVASDLAFPSTYYLKRLGKFKAEVDAYLGKYQIEGAQKFLAASSVWTGWSQDEFGTERD